MPLLTIIRNIIYIEEKYKEMRGSIISYSSG